MTFGYCKNVRKAIIRGKEIKKRKKEGRKRMEGGKKERERSKERQKGSFMNDVIQIRPFLYPSPSHAQMP